MILADTSVWVDHFRESDAELSRQLEQGSICTHPFVIIELCLGNLPDRLKTMAALDMLPAAKVARLSEVRHMIEAQSLFRKGIGFVDAHLLASVLITPQTVLWTRDKHLREVAERLGVDASIT